jgi:beta-mannanase
MPVLISILFLSFNSLNVNSNTEFKWGIYDKKREFFSRQSVKYDHFFSVWGQKHANDIDQAISFANYNNRDLLMTIEPWPLFNEVNGGHLFYNIIKNKYNEQIKTLCTALQTKTNNNVIIRWGHEMELYTTSRYPWSTPYPASFQEAYRTWVNNCRAVASKIKFMWSPAGNTGAEKYYPGDTYVDYIGFSAYSYPAYEYYTYKSLLTVETILNDRYNRLAKFNKPLIAAEFGIAGDMLTKQKNFESLKVLIAANKYPNLQAVIIFNSNDVSWIPDKISAPNFYSNNLILDKVIIPN